MSGYTCPICKEEMERDLIKFLTHTDQHIIDAVKKRHPEWVTQDGLCQKCVEYYKDEMKHGPSRCSGDLRLGK